MQYITHAEQRRTKSESHLGVICDAVQSESVQNNANTLRELDAEYKFMRKNRWIVCK